MVWVAGLVSLAAGGFAIASFLKYSGALQKMQ
jgi:hypothetical protein